MADSEAYNNDGALPGQRQRTRGRGRGGMGRNRRSRLLRGDPIESTVSVVVKGLPAETTDEAVVGRFATAGAISNVDSKVTRRDESKKVFFLTFADPAGATAAVASDGTVFNDVEIAVSRRIDGYTNDPVAVDPCRIFVGRLTTDIDEDRLTQIFGQYGSITNIEMARNGRFAHISYAAPDGAIAALGLHETDLDGSTIRVTPYKERPIPAETIMAEHQPEPTPTGERAARQPRERKPRELTPLDRRVFMAGFPEGYTSREVVETFPGAVRVAPRRRNFCVVNFDTPESAQAALARHGQPLCGAESLRIEMSER